MKLLPLLCLLSPWIGPESAQDITDAAPEPSLNKLEGTGDWRLLQCKVHGSPKPEVEWRDSSGNVLQSKEINVTEGGRFYVTSELIVTKTDHYTCVATQKEICHQFKTTVFENIQDAAPQPLVKKLEGTGDWSLWQCEVHGSPKPEVEWRDGSGNVLHPKEIKVTERERRFYVTSELNVTKTDHYTCVATQRDIHHQIKTTIFEDLRVQHKDNSGVSDGWILAVVAVVAVVVGVLLGFVVVLKVPWVRKRLSLQPQRGRSSNETNTPLNGYSSSAQMADPQIV